MFEIRDWNGYWHLFKGNEPVLRDDGSLLKLKGKALLEALLEGLNSGVKTIEESELYGLICDLSRAQSDPKLIRFSISSSLQNDLFIGALKHLNHVQSELNGSLLTCFRLYSYQKLPLIYCQDLRDYFSKKIQELGASERVFLAHFSTMNRHCLLPLWYLLDEISLTQLLETASVLCCLDAKPQNIQGEILRQLVYDFAEKNRRLFQFLALALPQDPR